MGRKPECDGFEHLCTPPVASSLWGRRGGGFGGGRRKGRRGDVEAKSGVGFDFDTFHPNDASGIFEDRPGGAVRPRNLHAFKHFLHLARGTRMPKLDAIPSLPATKQGSLTRKIGGQGSIRVGDLDAKAEGGCIDGSRHRNRNRGCNFRTVSGGGTKRRTGEA